jgi:hypothetical protein
MQMCKVGARQSDVTSEFQGFKVDFDLMVREGAFGAVAKLTHSVQMYKDGRRSFGEGDLGWPECSAFPRESKIKIK